MIDISILFSKVMLLLLMVVPGFIMAKCKLSTPGLCKGIANLILYVAQPALIIKGYVRDYDSEVMKRAAWVFVFALIVHLLFTALAFTVFRKGDEGRRRVLRFATVFTNAGYMGIPLICAIFNDEYAIYASIYVIVFNIFCWSLGSFIYTDEKKYISLRKMFFNPATIATYVGLLMFITPLNRLIAPLGDTHTLADIARSIPYDLMDGLQALVAPLSMLLIGLRLAEVDLRGAFRDRQLYVYLVLRLLISPALVWGVIRLCMLAGIMTDEVVMVVILLSAATPAATATSMFAEKFDGDSVYASKLVSISTLLSLATMPAVALLLYL
ncbi:MAG: AEC family transporter [Clostridia bacterium]|nr:AEC family transporter [Clostridia bacterium]